MARPHGIYVCGYPAAQLAFIITAKGTIRHEKPVFYRYFACRQADGGTDEWNLDEFYRIYPKKVSFAHWRFQLAASSEQTN